MQKNKFKKEENFSFIRSYKPREDEEIEERVQCGIIASSGEKSSKKTGGNMTTKDNHDLTKDKNPNHANQNKTAMQRFKQKFLRKNSKVTEEEVTNGNSENWREDIASTSKYSEDDHVYEVPDFTNNSSKKDGKEDSREEEEHVYENGYVWAANNIPRRNFRNRSESDKDDSNNMQGDSSVVCNEASNGCHQLDAQIDEANSRTRRWQQGKCMSLPANKVSGPPSGIPLPGLASKHRESLCGNSSDENSNEDPEDLQPVCKPSDDNMLIRSQSLPMSSKLSFSHQFLTGLNDLCKCGWYWGPLSSKEAEMKLQGKPDGTFLVRDSNDNHYLLSLSFRSEGRTLHTRIEFCKGKFSFYAAPFMTSGCHESIVDLIEDCVDKSKEKVFCYSKGRGHNGAAFPVRLMKALSRFDSVCTLQHLCRFVIRQHFSLENIGEMQLPGVMKKYLWKNHFDAKND